MRLFIQARLVHLRSCYQRQKSKNGSAFDYTQVSLFGYRPKLRAVQNLQVGFIQNEVKLRGRSSGRQFKGIGLNSNFAHACLKTVNSSLKPSKIYHLEV